VEVDGEIVAAVDAVAARRGLVRVDAAWRVHRGRSLLHVVLDRPGGVTLADLEGFHRELETVLVGTAAGGGVTLEVSSPGAERPLRTERDFQIFAGRPVRIAARAPVAGRREWSGWLVALDDGVVVIRLDGGEEVRLPWAEVAWARLRLP
jgi:ribosome maturation factor RimP